METMINQKLAENVLKTGQGQRLYIIEDETDIAELMRYNLTLEGFEVDVFYSGEVGLQAIEKKAPDLLLLDLMLPGVDGIEICRRLKSQERFRHLPVIMVSAKGEETDVVQGLELGADDYVAKPFSPKVLIARVKAVLRRKTEPKLTKDSIVERGGLVIHPGRFEVIVDGNKIDLTNFEFQILHFLARRPGWVFTRSQIVDAIHQENYAVTDRSVDFQMVGLRKKLGEMGQYIETVRGVGYRFREI